MDGGSGRPTASSRESTRACRSAAGTPWASITSSICRPMVMTGLREVMGSWKIIAIRAPRSLRSAGSGSVSRSCPSKRMRPDRTFRLSGGKRPMIVLAVTDLPDPDSPTMHRISPRCSRSETSRTAWARSPASGRSTVRPSISSSGSLIGASCETAAG
jgi:hypothetical protein